MTDLDYMHRALELAARGEGAVEPNPMVGAVVVRDGQIIGEGWHQRYGEAHAEVHALRAAGEAARGATLYVTLEPCCHFGKTPPCTDAILHAGIRRVVAAMHDPFPQVAGQGAACLRGAGVDVEIGIGGPAAHSLNAPYLKRLRAEKPWIHAKWAMTLDGRIATVTRESQWITGEPARAYAHRLRGRMDAIIVGRGTVVADNPRLTARPPGPRVATRIVLTTGHEPLPFPSALSETIREAPLLIATREDRLDRFAAYQRAGCELLPLPQSDDACLSLDALLLELGRRRMTNVLVEGGAGVLGSFLAAREIDEVHAFIAPQLVGGINAPGPIGGPGISRLIDRLELDEMDVLKLGGDVLLHGRIRR